MTQQTIGEKAIKRELQDLAVKLAVNAVEIADARQRGEIERAVAKVHAEEAARREQREKARGERGERC